MSKKWEYPFKVITLWTCHELWWFKNRINVVSPNTLICSSDGPEQVKVDGPQTVTGSDNITLSCQAVSVPPAEFSWFSKSSGSTSPQRIGHGPVYTAMMLSPGQRLVYICQARNPTTGVTAEVEISVDVLDGGSSFPQVL